MRRKVQIPEKLSHRAIRPRIENSPVSSAPARARAAMDAIMRTRFFFEDAWVVKDDWVVEDVWDECLRNSGQLMRAAMINQKPAPRMVAVSGELRIKSSKL